MQLADRLVANVSRAVVAREEVVRLSVISLLAGGHLLLDDLPGVGKTLLARSLARSIDGVFKRVQFTPDVLPSDITGASIFNQVAQRFEFIPGPIFANVVLADEVNRASTRTQSALLEAMAERQVTADGASHPLPDPFWVVATQNEVDGYGTFPLPQAQLDRFLISMSIGYPGVTEQVAVLERNEHGDPTVEPVVTVQDVREMQAMTRRVETARPVKEYLAAVVVATRSHPHVAVGVSPRGAVQLQRAAQAIAAMEGASFVTPEHIKRVAVPVLAHRLAPAPSTALTASQVIQDILDKTPVPF
jgi:MoxR-like ATPase